MGVFIAGSYSIVLILPAETLSDDRIALGTGAVLSLGYIGGFLGPWIGGAILDSHGSFDYLVYTLAASSCLMLIATLGLRETGHRGRAPTPCA